MGIEADEKFREMLDLQAVARRLGGKLFTWGLILGALKSRGEGAPAGMEALSPEDETQGGRRGRRCLLCLDRLS